MQNIRMSFTALFLTMALAACQPAGSPAPSPLETQVEADLPASPPESSVTQTSASSVPQEEATMNPVIPPDETAKNLVSLVKGHLAQRLNTTAEQIVLTDIQPVVWRDAGLGCPKPGVDYIQMETPGYRIVLETNGRTYNYHTDSAKRFVLCNR